jgi:hypothetical protein
MVGKDGALQLSSAGMCDGSWRAPLHGPAWPGESDCKYHDAPVAIVQANGDCALNLIYEKHSVSAEAAGVEHGIITLRYKVQALRVELHFRVYPHEDVIEQWTVVRNGLNAPVRVTRLDSDYWSGPSNSNAHIEWCDSRVPPALEAVAGSFSNRARSCPRLRSVGLHCF